MYNKRPGWLIAYDGLSKYENELFLELMHWCFKIIANLLSLIMYEDRDLIELWKCGDREQSASREPLFVLTPSITSLVALENPLFQT